MADEVILKFSILARPWFRPILRSEKTGVILFCALLLWALPTSWMFQAKSERVK